MGMCGFCGGWDCIFCNPHDLVGKARKAKEQGTEKEFVEEILALYNTK